MNRTLFIFKLPRNAPRRKWYGWILVSFMCPILEQSGDVIVPQSHTVPMSADRQTMDFSYMMLQSLGLDFPAGSLVFYSAYHFKEGANERPEQQAEFLRTLAK